MRSALRMLLYCVLAASLAGCSGGVFGVSPLPYNASGRVVDSADNGIPGVTLLFSDGYGTAETGNDGQWLKSYLQGRVTVTPSGAGMTFTPSQSTVSPTFHSVTFVAVPAEDDSPPEPDPGEQETVADQEVSTDEDSTIVVDVLSGIEGEGLVIIDVTQPSNGTAAITPDQKIEYIPNQDFCGDDSFTYTVSKPQGGTATGTVTVTVRPTPDAPVAANEYFSITVSPEGTPFAVLMGLLGNDLDVDGDSLQVISVSPPTYGQVIEFWPEGSVHYSPPVGFEGLDTFVYTISDGTGRFSSAVVTVDVSIE